MNFVEKIIADVEKTNNELKETITSYEKDLGRDLDGVEKIIFRTAWSLGRESKRRKA